MNSCGGQHSRLAFTGPHFAQLSCSFTAEVTSGLLQDDIHGFSMEGPSFSQLRHCIGSGVSGPAVCFSGPCGASWEQVPSSTGLQATH